MIKAKCINAYLLDAPEILILNRNDPLTSTTPQMFYGNKPTDGGYLSNISVEEAEEIRKNDLIASKYLKPIIGAEELINNKQRYCLWLVGAAPTDVKNSSTIRDRVAKVKEMRLASKAPTTRSYANHPTLFRQVAQPTSKYLAVPIHSSENREYVPMAIYEPNVVASNALLTISNADLPIFALLQSSIFAIWNATISGRLESRFRISAQITYNNFPFPDLTESQRKILEKTGQAILDARVLYPNASLATLYDPNSMPPELRKAHQENDKAVLACFGLKKDVDDAIILAHLFTEYSRLVGGN